MTTNAAAAENSSWRSLVAGACAGVVSKTATAPIERVKLLIQLKENNQKSQYGDTVWGVIKDVYQREGLLSFWRGNTPSVIQKGGNSALNFMLMDWYKTTISKVVTRIYGQQASQEPTRSSRIVNSLLSGGLSGATTTTFLYPLEFLRTRLAVDIANAGETTRQYSGMRDVFTHTVETDGFRGIYKGYGTSIWYVALHRLVYLGGFDILKTEVVRFHKQRQEEKATTSLTMMERIAVAQSVSMLAATVCYPLDTVRRRLMMQAGRTVEEREYRNWWDCTKKVYRQEGVRGFFRGLIPNLAKTIGGALLLVAYDSVRSAM